MCKTFVAKQRFLFYVEKFQSLHVACFAVIFHSENVKYTHQSEQALPCQNKLNDVASSSFGIWTALFLCASFCRRAFSAGWELQSRVQHYWVFYQMDTWYESGLGFSQSLNVCVGLHIAYLETTQVP